MHSIEDHINIETTQQIALEHSQASIGERVLAAFIDYFILFAYALFASLVAHQSGTAIIVLLIPAFFYQLIMPLIYTGQSVGKKIMKIKIVRLDGGKCTFLTYFIRWTFRMIDINLSAGAIGTIFIILNSKGQRIGDIAAGTCVVRISANVNLDSIIVELPPEYKPQFSQVINLSDSDVKTLHEVVDMWNQSLDFTNMDMNEARVIAGRARTAYEKKLSISSPLQDSVFLSTLLKDYYYYHQAGSANLA